MYGKPNTWANADYIGNFENYYFVDLSLRGRGPRRLQRGGLICELHVFQPNENNSESADIFNSFVVCVFVCVFESGLCSVPPYSSLTVLRF